jgi:hypothetical protein
LASQKLHAKSKNAFPVVLGSRSQSILGQRGAAMASHSQEHVHRRPKKRDFEGKTITRFHRSADNIWRIWFTDGTAFGIQSEIFYPGLACMELCDVCAKPAGSGDG